jgi:glycosyltransferase involved in cell wall biosynthesis
VKGIKMKATISYLTKTKDFINVVRCSDLYFLPATSAYYFGGVGVSIMEALAAGLPVVSPTLVHFPEKTNVKHIGILTPWLDSERDLKKFVELLVYAVESIDQFKPLEIREVARKYYSWESFVNDVEQTLGGML